MVIFSEVDHKYVCDGVVYNSVSSLIEPYKTFDKGVESFRMALKAADPSMYAELSKAYGYRSGDLVSEMLIVYDRSHIEELQAGILKEWEQKGLESRNKGTLFHKVMEERDIMNRGSVNPFTGEWFDLVDVRLPGYDNNSVEYLADLVDGYYPELVLFDHDERVAGQADKVYVKRPYIWIDDWKTDQKVDTKSFYTKRYGFTFLKPPLSHIHDCNYWIYALKISCYAHMLTNAGFEVAELGFTHVGGGHEGGDYLYRLPFLQKEILEVLNQRKCNTQKPNSKKS